MSVKDIIKNKVYESFVGSSGWDVTEMLIIFGMACLIGFYIYAVYRMTSKKAFYSKDLNVTMAGMVIVVAAIIVAMQSSLIVSLGMVGALSIVRFRNAVKNPIDLLYLFWAISSGIICGVGLYVLVILLAVVMTGMLLLLDYIPNVKANGVLVLSCARELKCEDVKAILNEHSKFFKEKSRSICEKEIEIIYEIRTNNEEKLLEELKSIKELKKINYLTHDGEFRI